MIVDLLTLRLFIVIITLNIINYILNSYMNGRLDKVVMTAKIMRMKTGLYKKTWYPEWDDRQRGSANRILTNVLEVLDEYWE